MFIKEYIDFPNQTTLLWNFPADKYNIPEITEMLNMLSNNTDIINLYNSSSWHGCFASCSVISREDIEILNTKYNIFILLDVITKVDYQTGFERLFPVLLESIYTYISKCSLLGNIYYYIDSIPGYYWNYSYDRYISDNPTKSIIKIWTGRK